MDSSSPQAEKNPSQYKRLFHEIRRRTTTPASHPPFVIYFLVVMVVISPATVWLEIGTYVLDWIAPVSSPPSVAPNVALAHSVLSGGGIRTALLTFFPAVAASTAMQLIWAANKDMRAFAMLVFTGLLILTAVSAPSRIGNSVAISIGVFATIISLWLWWIANADQQDLLGDLSLAAPIGGDDANKPLRGDLSGFKIK